MHHALKTVQGRDAFAVQLVGWIRIYPTYQASYHSFPVNVGILNIILHEREVSLLGVPTGQFIPFMG